MKRALREARRIRLNPLPTCPALKRSLRAFSGTRGIASQACRFTPCIRRGRSISRICDNTRPPSPIAHVARLDQTPFQADIIDLTHDGRGVARRDNGKTVFIAGALPGEQVLAKQIGRNRNFDEAVTLEVLQASPDRVTPRCPHFGTCGGCALQHLDQSRQILAKQRCCTTTSSASATSRRRRCCRR